MLVNSVTFGHNIYDVNYLHELFLLCCKQEARRAAEKAYAVAKVDERVSKAVTAANKAANAARVAAVKAVQRQMHHNNIDDGPTPFI